MQSRRKELGFDDGKEFKRSSRKKFGGGRPKGPLKDFPYLNIQRASNMVRSTFVEDEIEEETSSEEGV